MRAAAPPGLTGFSLRDVAMSLPGAPGPVLRDLNLSAGAGQVIGISGANGAGKTTLLRVAAGLLRPQAGAVALDRLDPEHHGRDFRRSVALLSADGGLYARLSVRRHLQWWAAMAYVPAPDRAAAVARVLVELALEDLAGRRVERLSAGQRQRVRLAMAFLPHPRLLLLDEPEARLDDDSAGLLAERVRAHAEAGGITVWTAPEGQITRLQADERLLLHAGALRAA